MSDGGGDEGGGKGGGGGKGSDDNKPSSGFSPTGQGVNAPSNADVITAPPSALPLFNSSTDISATDGSSLGGTSAGQAAGAGASTTNTANTANLNTASGITAPAAGGVGAASIAPVAANVGGTPADLTTDLSARSNTGDPNFPGGAPLPQSKPAIPGQDNSLDNLAATGNTAGTTPPTNLLSPDQLGQPASPAAATEASGTSTAKSTSDKSSGGVLNSLGIKNPAGTALAAGGLAYSVINGQNANTKQASQLAPSQLQAVQDYLKSAQAASQATAGNATAQTENAKQLYTQGQNLVQYLQTGTLPPDAQASLDQATASAKAAIKSRYASQGLNTDPTQNSVLNQELQQIDQQAIASKSNLEQQYQQSGTQLIAASQAAAAASEQISSNITSSGVAAAGLSSDLYKTLMGIDQTAQKEIGDAISNFSKSISGGGASGSGTTINVGSK